MAFARWDPIRDLLTIQQRLDRLGPSPAGWVPPVDLVETPDDIIVIAEIPGVAREHLDVHVADGWLHIAGTRQERAVACEQYHRIERGHGSFTRALQLPAPVDATGVAADLRDGVLTITCPKVHDAGPRRVTIA